ncbi:MAG TPA: NapC/NirT family cytochrome c [Mycobacterium sp.]|nr:NapC/NirT family cytochrome c [Mycobacterium sp.]
MSSLPQAATGRLRAPRPGSSSPPHVVLNPITITGALVALVGVGGSGFALVAGFLDAEPSAAKGIVGYVMMPSVALGGVVLMLVGIVIGAWRQARSAAVEGGLAGVHIEVGSARQLLGIGAFAIIAIGSVTVLGGTTYRAIEFTESTTFCGTCHNVMQPEVDAHLTSPHAEVECTKCHIAYQTGPLGPNTTAYIQSKIGGVRQMISVLTNSYDTPVRAPASKIPSTNTTCQGCHAPNKDYGTVIRQFTSYGSDEGNTRSTRALAFPVGGGTTEPNGIHWHASAKVWYRPTDDSKSTIAWVGVEKSDGTLEEWINPNVPLSQGGPKTLMSCIDCHNRVGHRIPSPDELVDAALDGGRMDRTLPYVKRESLRLLGANGEGTNPDQLSANFKQPGWFDQLAGFYTKNYPDIALSKHDAIKNAIGELKRISTQIIYPQMKADWLTYPDNLSHQLPEGIKLAAGQDNPGCFRCHGTLVRSDTKELLPGTMGGNSCLACHGSGAPSNMQISASDPTKTQTCTLCHVNVDANQLSGAAPGASPPVPLDDIHQSQ